MIATLQSMEEGNRLFAILAFYAGSKQELNGESSVTHPPPRPPKIPYHTLVNALASSNNGNFVLPGRMMLEEVVSLLVDIW